MKTWKGDELAYAHVKRDGHMLDVKKDTFGRVTCTTRRPTDITEQIKFVPTLQGAWTHMESGHVCGELWVPGEPASFIKTAIKQRDERLRFDVFSIPSRPDIVRLSECARLALKWGFRFIDWYARPGDLEGSQGPFNCPSQLDTGGDIEGYVMKDGNLLNHQKYKPVRTIDLIVCGYTDGKGKHEGFIGSLVCKTYEGDIIANVGGMSDDEREEFSCNERGYLGAVVEVRYQYVGSKGKLRHPTFVRLREDKPAEECTRDQDERLRDHYERV